MQMCAGLMLDMVWMGGVRDNEPIPCALTSMPHLHATPSLLSKVTIDFGTWPMSPAASIDIRFCFLGCHCVVKVVVKSEGV